MPKKLKTMKNILLFCLMIFTLKVNSQSFNEYEVPKINSFGLNLNELDLSNQKVNNDLKSILKKEQQRKSNKSTSIVLAALSVLTTTTGIIIVSKPKTVNEMDYLNEAGAYENLIGGFFIAAGVIEAGISIPLFFTSNKRKKERDKLIELYKE
ncbi:MAG: hypothetical protein CVT95_10980 [Bacteroidetes bacterium HGW-Bacteroidetes-12]|nr:MAG: hypothetical protein CVT95_10980 [Bacteroidetes bacterium HGW-Bacteroidetes-12]